MIGRIRKGLLVALLSAFPLLGNDHPTPLLSVGGGYFFAGKNHSGGLFQAEYKSGMNFWGFVRPEAVLITPELRSVFLGAGVAFEFHVSDNFIFSPSFVPGLYYRGKGKNLGYPVEFRSSLELSYVFRNEARLGTQFYHISNASISHRNPGANALTFFLALPFCYFNR
jgi:lipid A 3-O-deacylase